MQLIGCEGKERKYYITRKGILDDNIIDVLEVTGKKVFLVHDTDTFLFAVGPCAYNAEQYSMHEAITGAPIKFADSYKELIKETEKYLLYISKDKFFDAVDLWLKKLTQEQIRKLKKNFDETL